MKITFFIPSKIYGGLEILYIRCIKHLALLNYQIEVIDYECGIVSSELKKKNINFIHSVYTLKQNPVVLNELFFKSRNAKITIDNDITILSLKYLPIAKKYFKGNSKLLFWDEHPSNLISHLKHQNISKYFNGFLYLLYLTTLGKSRLLKLKKNMTIASKNRGIYFMCKSNFDMINKYTQNKIEIQFIQIPIERKELCNAHIINKKIINASYIGRLDKDKFMICVLLIKEIIKYNMSSESTIIKLTVFGSGNKYDDVFEFARDYSDFIEFMGSIKVEEINCNSFNKFDISFAVGTSALETAAMGIPTALLYSGFCSNWFIGKFLWLCESKNYELSLVDDISDNSHIHTLESLIQDYITNYCKISNLCYSYIRDNHYIDIIIKKLIDSVNSCSLTLKDLK